MAATYRRRVARALSALLGAALAATACTSAGGGDAAGSTGSTGSTAAGDAAAREYGERLAAWADDLVAAARRPTPENEHGQSLWRSLEPVLAEQPALEPVDGEAGEAYDEATGVAGAVDAHAAELAAYEDAGLALRRAGVRAGLLPPTRLVTEHTRQRFALYDANAAILLSGAPDDAMDRRRVREFRKAFAADRDLLAEVRRPVERLAVPGELGESGRAAWVAEIEWCRTQDEELTAYLDGVRPQDAEPAVTQNSLFECGYRYAGTVAAAYYQRGRVTRALAGQVAELAAVLAGGGADALPTVGDAYRAALTGTPPKDAHARQWRLWMLWRIRELEQTDDAAYRSARATLVHDDPDTKDRRSDLVFLFDVMNAFDIGLDAAETAGVRDWALSRLEGPGPVQLAEVEPDLVAQLERVAGAADWQRVRSRVVRLLDPVTTAVDDRRKHAAAVAEAVEGTRP